MFASLRRLGVVFVLAALALTAGSSSAWAGTLTHDQAQELRLYGAGLVVARPGAGPALRRAGGVKIATALPVWRVPSRGALQVLPGLVRDGLVSDISADQPLSTFEEPLQHAEWWIPAVGVDRAVAPGPGKPLTVIDTGVDMTHEEFATRPGTTVLNPQTTSGRLEEHGTAVASVAAASVNGLGIVGVYPQAALQLWDASPTGDGITTGDVIRGLDAAIRRGPGVVNLSLGSQVRNPVLDAMVAVTVGSGTLVVAAAGNSRERGSPLEYPASLPHVLTVGALDQEQCAGVLLERLAARRPLRAGREHPGGDSADVPPAELLRPHLQRHELRLADRRGRRRLGLDRAADARPQPALRGTCGPRRRTSRRRATTLSPGSAGSTSPARSPSHRPPSDPQEPNEDVSHVKPNGLLRRAAKPLTAAGRKQRRRERAPRPRRGSA